MLAWAPPSGVPKLVSFETALVHHRAGAFGEEFNVPMVTDWVECNDGQMRKRVYQDPDARPNMGVDRKVSVFADFTPEGGLWVFLYDSTSWPQRDRTWELRVAPDHTEMLREALGAKSGEDTFDVVLNRFEDGTISPWVSLPKWLREHDIQFTEAEKWDDN